MSRLKEHLHMQVPDPYFHEGITIDLEPHFFIKTGDVSPGMDRDSPEVSFLREFQQMINQLPAKAGALESFFNGHLHELGLALVIFRGNQEHTSNDLLTLKHYKMPGTFVVMLPSVIWYPNGTKQHPVSKFPFLLVKWIVCIYS